MYNTNRGNETVNSANMVNIIMCHNIAIIMISKYTSLFDGFCMICQNMLMFGLNVRVH